MNATMRLVGMPWDDQVDEELSFAEPNPPPPRLVPEKPMSLATDLNTGGVLLGIEQRFAHADEARRRELDELIRAGNGNATPSELKRLTPGTALPGPSSDRADDGRTPPAPPPRGHSAEGGTSLNPQSQETTMEVTEEKRCTCGRQIRATPDGKRHDQCSGCRGTSSSLKPKNGAKPPPATKPAAETKVAPKPRLVNPEVDRGLEALDVDDLVELREAVTAELRRRRDDAATALRALEKVLEDAA